MGSFRCDISVIITCYNQEQFISKCIDSVLNQDFIGTVEIIIGDDASTDDTPKILRNYAEKYSNIQLILREKNIGATANSYNLIMSAKGKYLAAVEGDDFWSDNHKLTQQFEMLENHPEYIACYHRTHLVDYSGNMIKGKIYWLKYKKIFSLADFDGIHLPGHSSSWMRRNLFPQYNEQYTAVYRLSESIGDRTAALFYLSKGNFALIDKDMSAYRYTRGTQGSITSYTYDTKIHSLETEITLIAKLCDYAENQLDRKIHTSKYKSLLFFKAMAINITQHSTKSYEILKKAYSMCGIFYALLSVFWCPFFLIWKKINYIE